MTGVSVAIQAHPLRAEMAAELNECLDGLGDVVFDPSPEERRSPWRTYREALERTAGWPDFDLPCSPSHRLVIQDDVLVCEGFVEAVDAAVAARPDRVVAFFVGGNPANHRRAVQQAQARGVSWAELEVRPWVSAVATCWPVRLIGPLLRFVDAQRWPPTFTADDEIIGRFLYHAGERPLATVPSLVEHPDTVPSIAGKRPADGRDPGRRAAVWIGDLGFCDGRTIDWT